MAHGRSGSLTLALVATVLALPASVHAERAVVWFANSARGLRLAWRILPLVLPGEHPSLDWLQVGRALEE